MATVEIESWPVLNEKCSAGGWNKGTIEAQRCHIFRAAGNAMFMFEGNVLFRGGRLFGDGDSDFRNRQGDDG